MNNKSKLVILIIVLILFNLFCYFGFILYKNIFYLAYLSVQSGCNLIDDKELNNLNYFVAGYFNSVDNSITYLNETDIVMEFEVSKEVILHENCHKYINSVGLSHSCDYPTFVYIEEVCCYSYGYFWG